MYAKERLYLTANKDKVVADGDKRAAFLYATPGDEIPESAVKRFGLVDGGLAKKGKAKDQKSDPNKGGGSKAGTADDLTKLKGIGKTTATALAEAGIDTFEALAAIDPETPPIMIPGTGEADWAAWTVAAKEAAEKADGGGDA